MAGTKTHMVRAQALEQKIPSNGGLFLFVSSEVVKIP